MPVGFQRRKYVNHLQRALKIYSPELFCVLIPVFLIFDVYLIHIDT